MKPLSACFADSNWNVIDIVDNDNVDLSFPYSSWQELNLQFYYLQKYSCLGALLRCPLSELTCLKGTF